MSYGQPCRRITGGPLGGPASAYPTFRTPASTCFRGPNEARGSGAPPVAGVGFIRVDDACAAPAVPSFVATTVATAFARNRRRPHFVSSAISATPAEISNRTMRRTLQQGDYPLVSVGLPNSIPKRD